MSFIGKTFVVTGGSSGIGRATAIMLAQSGAHVFIVGRDEKRLKETAKFSKNIFFVRADFATPESIKETANFIAENVTEISGFVHSAGEIYTEPFETFRIRELLEMERVNVNAGFELLQDLMPIFKKGAVVFVSSIDAFFGETDSPSSGYSLTKGALVSLTRALASELGVKGIRVNCVAPGLIRTRMTEDFFTDLFKDQRERFLSRVPLGREGRPEEVARVIAFLLSDDASYVNGDTIFIDGGYHVR